MEPEFFVFGPDFFYSPGEVIFERVIFPDPVSSSEEVEQKGPIYRWSAGRKFRVYENGAWEYMPAGSPGKFGEPTELMRVPASLVPLVSSMMEKMLELETARRNIVVSVWNTSPEFVAPFQKYKRRKRKTSKKGRRKNAGKQKDARS